MTQDDATRQLAERYAPVVYLRDQEGPCDTRGSPYAPVPVEFLFEIENIVLKRHDGGRTTEEERAITAADLYGKDDTYFLDFPGNPKRPGCTYERDYVARTDAYPPTAYAHVAYEDGRDGFALQYWLFYYFNHWNNTHEGDWEMIQLNFEGPTPADALTQEPSGVGYSQHAGGERSSWDDDKLSKEGARPVAFIAAGANANQFEPNIILGRGDNGTGFGCDDARRPSRRVALDVQLMEEPASASDEFAWLNFDGRWGERAPWEFNGPTGPSDKRAWTEPFSWHEDLRPSSVIVPSGDTLGLNAVNFFCDAVWYLSTPFAYLVRLPAWASLAGVVGVFACIGLIATRTRYRPVLTESLRERRRFGQVLSSAARLYRLRALLFIGIGLIFIPAGFVEAAIQWVVLRTPFFDTLAGFFADHRFVDIAVALALGSIAANIVYWFVLAATLAAVARIERNRVNGVSADYGDVFRAFAALAVPRLKALGIVFVLALTVVGIPWAIRNTVRWAFIEETILLDGTPSASAAATSARAIDGHWWYTAWCLLGLLLAGYIIGPAIAVVLLFVGPFPVSWINPISSLIFVAVAPFIGICHALLYLDRTSDRPPPAADEDERAILN